MFFPEHLLSKSGPLARVWLAANLERKLSRNQILQDKIGEDIAVITRPDVAGGPMALRLSGQLLLGVVRIYSRKARYLLEDCEGALTNLKVSFRRGDIDLGPNQSHTANPATLTLPDRVTELDLLAPMPDPFLLGSQALTLNLGLDDTIVQDWDNSQFLSGSIEQPRLEHATGNLEDASDLEIDLGEDMEFDEGTSIERGRDAPLERRLSEEFAPSPKGLEDDGDIGLDFGEDDDTIMPPGPDVDIDLGMDDVDMGGMTELEPLTEAPIARERSMSPLSEIDPDQAKELEQTFTENQTAFEPEEEEGESVQQAQRVKRRKVLQSDAETQIPNNQIRDQQNDRSKILKPASFLPRDPTLAALQHLQRSGGFISSILGDGRNRGWAPELRGILSLELISRPGQKRKRDSGVADLDTEEEAATGEKTPQLQFEQTEEELQDVGPIGGDTSLGLGDDDVIQLPGDDDVAQFDEPLEDEPFSPIADNFDDTTAPLLHPAESGPISLGTKHAVHILRDIFGSEEEAGSDRQKKSVLFQDMLPEATTTKADATKMFFEVLVLATKDAIKVEQPVNELGGPLRVRAKRALFWDMAERSASGELGSQAVTQEAPVVAVEA